MLSDLLYDKKNSHEFELFFLAQDKNKTSYIFTLFSKISVFIAGFVS